MLPEKKELIDSLNKDLAAEWGTIARYTYQAAKATGIGGFELRALLQKEIPDELGHASYLSDVIADLGGEPQTKGSDFDRPEAIRDILKQDIAREEEDIESYRRHAELANSMGEIAVKVHLEEIAADENKHARELRRLLRGL